MSARSISSDRQLLLRVESEQLLLERERVERRARGVRDEKRFAAVDVEEAQAGRALLGQLRRSWFRSDDSQTQDQRDDCPERGAHCSRGS